MADADKDAQIVGAASVQSNHKTSATKTFASTPSIQCADTQLGETKADTQLGETKADTKSSDASTREDTKSSDASTREDTKSSDASMREETKSDDEGDDTQSDDASEDTSDRLYPDYNYETGLRQLVCS
jgi:hypothetical protein